MDQQNRQTNKFLIINRHAPYDSHYAQESIEFALTLASLEYPVTLLFCQEAILQLVDNRSELIKNFQALNIYGINNIYADPTAFDIINTKKLSLVVDIKQLSKQQIFELITEHDIIFNF